MSKPAHLAGPRPCRRRLLCQVICEAFEATPNQCSAFIPCSHDIYDDWRVLSNVHGMRSMAAAPLSVSTKAYGVLLLASDDPQCINKA